MRKSGLFLYPDNALDHSQNLMGSKMEQDPSSLIFSLAVSTSSIHVILLTDKQTKKKWPGK